MHLYCKPNIMKMFILLVSLVLTFVINVHSQTSLKGEIFDSSTNQKIAFARIILYNNYCPVDSTLSNVKGEYLFENLNERSYDIVVSSPPKTILLLRESLVEGATHILDFYLYNQVRMPINALSFAAPSVAGLPIERITISNKKQKLFEE